MPHNRGHTRRPGATPLPGPGPLWQPLPTVHTAAACVVMSLTLRRAPGQGQASQQMPADAHGTGHQARPSSFPGLLDTGHTPQGHAIHGSPVPTPDVSTHSASVARHLGGGVTDPEAQGRLSEATDGLQWFPWERPPSSQGPPLCTVQGQPASPAGSQPHPTSDCPPSFQPLLIQPLPSLSSTQPSHSEVAWAHSGFPLL